VRFVDEFRDAGLGRVLSGEILATVEPGRHYKLMEVCGGHTHSIYKYGVDDLLPANVELVHGPGCPVCVIPMGRVDDGIALAREPGVIFTCFGDMMRVPGSRGTLLDAKAQAFVASIYKNVPVLDSGARGSTTTFVERGIGDVLIAWENEALLAIKELGPGKFEIVAPSLSILAEPPVAVVDKVAGKHGTKEVAQAYLQYLYTDAGQEIVAQNFYRPRNPAVAAKYASQYPKLNLVTVNDVFGGWKRAHETHFADGALFDQIYQPGR
jgi:hypothetical protein